MLLAFGAFVVAGMSLRADSPVVPSGAGSVGQYLAAHENDLAPFFDKNGAALMKDSFPILLDLGAKILLAVLLAGWFVDVVLGRAFSAVFAPAYAKLPKALIYATGRLVLSLVLSVILTFALMLGLNFLGAGVPAVVIVAVLAIPALVAQMIWVSYVYRSKLGTSAGFYIVLLAVHTLLIVMVAPIFFAGEVNGAITAYVDEKLAPRLHAEAEAARHEGEGDIAQSAAVQAKVTALQGRITQAQTDEQDLQKAIEDRKNSAAFVFSRLVKLRAGGDLAGARAQFADFLQRFPNDPLADAAKGQLGEIDQALAAETALQKQQQADADRTAAKARADLLARADAGQVTLSEMRAALLGKTPAEVSALFGQPSETASNRWGYGKRMVMDPASHTSMGLTVIFSDGLVQGVDYYYGSAP